MGTRIGGKCLPSKPMPHTTVTQCGAPCPTRYVGDTGSLSCIMYRCMEPACCDLCAIMNDEMHCVHKQPAAQCSSSERSCVSSGVAVHLKCTVEQSMHCAYTISGQGAQGDPPPPPPPPLAFIQARCTCQRFLSHGIQWALVPSVLRATCWCRGRRADGCALISCCADAAGPGKSGGSTSACDGHPAVRCHAPVTVRECVLAISVRCPPDVDGRQLHSNCVHIPPVLLGAHHAHLLRCSFHEARLRAVPEHLPAHFPRWLQGYGCHNAPSMLQKSIPQLCRGVRYP